MATKRQELSVLSEMRPGAWSAQDAGAYDALLHVMDEAQEVCAARMEHALSQADSDVARRGHTRWREVSARISDWREAIRPDNREAVQAASGYCVQVIEDYATVLPIQRALETGTAHALTTEAEVVRVDSTWWIAEEDRYIPLDPDDPAHTGFIATLNDFAARVIAAETAMVRARQESEAR